jgi:hypothetical protein
LKEHLENLQDTLQLKEVAALGRTASAETFRAMLNLKVIWATSALFAIGAGIAEGAPSMAWVVLGIFAVFWVVWVYYRLRLK